MGGVQKIKTITFISPHKSQHAVVKEMLADLLFVILNTERFVILDAKQDNYYNRVCVRAIAADLLMATDSRRIDARQCQESNLTMQQHIN